MKIYVAGRDLTRAGKVIIQLREAGHTITYDWVAMIDDTSNLAQKAIDERAAIRNSDVLVYLWETDQESARYEAGMAMGLDIPIVVSGKEDAHFFALPNVKTVKSDYEINEVIAEQAI